MKDLGAGANPPPETEQDKKDEPEVKEQGAGSEQNTAASGDMGEASDAQKAGNTNGAAASSEAEGNAEAQEQKADTSRSLAAVCDAGEDSVLIIVTSDGYCSFVKSSCYAVSRNNLKGRKLVKLHDGARVAAVQVATAGERHSCSVRPASKRKYIMASFAFPSPKPIMTAAITAVIMSLHGGGGVLPNTCTI